VTRLIAFWLLSAVLAAPTAAAQTPSAASAAESLSPRAYTSGPVRPDALQLAKLMMPEDLYLEMIERITLTGFNAGVGDGGTIDERALEALRDELPKLAREYERAALPRTYDRYARALGDHFSPEEVKQLESFYRTRTGQKVIVGKFAGIDLGGVLSKWTADPGAAVTSSDIEGLNRGAVSKMIRHFDEADERALLTFTQQPVFKRLLVYNTTLIALETQIAGEPDPEFDAKVQAVVEAAIRRFPAAPPTS
jgi:hypothetical protein